MFLCFRVSPLPSRTGLHPGLGSVPRLRVRGSGERWRNRTDSEKNYFRGLSERLSESSPTPIFTSSPESQSPGLRREPGSVMGRNDYWCSGDHTSPDGGERFGVRGIGPSSRVLSKGTTNLPNLRGTRGRSHPPWVVYHPRSVTTPTPPPDNSNPTTLHLPWNPDSDRGGSRPTGFPGTSTHVSTLLHALRQIPRPKGLGRFPVRQGKNGRGSSILHLVCYTTHQLPKGFP